MRDQPKFCTRCGAPRSSRRFCVRCGFEFPASEPASGPVAVHEVGVAAGGTDGGDAAATDEPRSAAVPGQTAGGATGGTGGSTPPAFAALAHGPPPPPPSPAAPPDSSPQLQPPDPGGRNRGLIACLAAAVAVLAAGIVAAVLIASGGSRGTPTVGAPTQSTSARRTTTMTKVIAHGSKTPSLKASSSTNASVAKVPATSARSHAVPSSSPVGDKAAIRGVIHRHWDAVEKGNYRAAFALLVPGTQRESSWIAAHKQDQLVNASISLGSPTLTSSTTATVPVHNLHTEAASGCFNWSGSYKMQKVGGNWRIGKADISRSAC